MGLTGKKSACAWLESQSNQAYSYNLEYVIPVSSRVPSMSSFRVIVLNSLVT